MMNSWRRASLGVRLLTGTTVALLAIIAVGSVSLTLLVRQRTAAAELAHISHAQRILQDADMQHDAIRADVYAVLLDSRAAEPLAQLHRDIAAYRTLISQAQASAIDAALRQEIVAIEPELERYLTIATEVAHNAEDRALTETALPQFRDAFTRLGKQNTALTDRFAARVVSADERTRATLREGIAVIGIASLLAMLIVAATSRFVSQSIAAALGRVSHAAREIAGGNLSVRSEVVSTDDVGAVGVAVNDMADRLQTIIGKLQAEQEQDAFSRHLSEVLDMADTESDAYAVVARGMTAVSSEMPMELLLADSSRAHLERATVAPGHAAPSCQVESPYGCMAVRRGTPIVFEQSGALNACGKLRERGTVPNAAVCVPLSFMGRSVGVLHATCDSTPSPRVVSQLTTLGILSGGRIGIVRAFQKTQVAARTDSLTGLANRRSLEAQVRSLAAGTAYAVVLADLDHFKRLNDTHGHEAGDRALRVFSDVLRRSLRDVDMPGRWGGEEFMLVLRDRTAHEAMQIVDRIRENLEIAGRAEGAPVFTSSFGIADSTMGHDFAQLARVADDALYQSKEGGRNRGTIGNPARVISSVPRRGIESAEGIDVAGALDAA